MSSFGDYDQSVAEGAVSTPLIGDRVHPNSCKCDPCKQRRKGARTRQCSNLCMIGVGVATVIALACLTMFAGSISSALSTIVASPTPSPVKCPDCTLECPAAPGCELKCPDVPACPSQKDCPDCTVDCPDPPVIPPCPDFPECEDKECPNVHCRECGDCIGGSRRDHQTGHVGGGGDDDDSSSSSSSSTSSLSSSSSSSYFRKRSFKQYDICSMDTCDLAKNVRQGKIVLPLACVECYVS